MQPVWRLFPNLTAAVKVSHDQVQMVGTGHDFDHALQVAQVAVLIAEDDDTGRLAGAAGLCHNADRLLQKELGIGKKDVPEEKVVAMVNAWLDTEAFTEPERVEIMEAVLRHSGLNQDSDGPVQMTLMDADRIACSNADSIMGAAAFWRELPTLDPKHLTYDPTAHCYKSPKSVLKNLECHYDWADPTSKVCVRLPKAKQWMGRNAAFTRGYIALVEKQRREMGLWPDYPF